MPTGTLPDNASLAFSQGNEQVKQKRVSISPKLHGDEGDLVDHQSADSRRGVNDQAWQR
jgi:hypothetical protein